MRALLKFLLLTTGILILHIPSFSQVHTCINRYPLKSTISINKIVKDWNITLQCIEVADTEPGKSHLQYLKSLIPPKIRNNTNLQNYSLANRNIPLPFYLRNFAGNVYNNTVPNDNNIAISNDGKIVSVSNSLIYFFCPDSAIHPPISLGAFADTLKLPEGKYDPRVLYDPAADRFIIACLNGFNDSTSKIIVAFSKTNDPTGDWNIYSLPGNPLSDTSWSDFPEIAINKDELFLTVNLLKNDSNWKKGFKQSIIFQINKSTGYNGDSLLSKFYSNIKYNGSKVRNICPIKEGSTFTATNLYFLSDNNFALRSDSIFIVEITGELNNSSTKLIASLTLSDSSYGVPPTADQPKNWLLETNDARILDGYLQDDNIYFVGNSVNFRNNFATFFHGKISQVSSTRNTHINIIDHPYLEFGYPSIAYTGNSNSPDESIILFDHTADTVYPGASAMFYKNGTYSDIIRLKEGNYFTSILSQKVQRWGDYTGVQRKYNEDGVVWGAGYYIQKLFTNPLYIGTNNTWIFELKSPDVSSIPTISNNPTSILVYPNPSSGQYTVDFYTDKTAIMKFVLYDMKGEQVAYLLHNVVKEGKNLFTFNISSLKSGTYFLRISRSDGFKLSKEIIKL